MKIKVTLGGFATGIKGPARKEKEIKEIDNKEVK